MKVDVGRSKSRIIRVARLQLALAIGITAIMLLGMTASANSIFVRNGYYNDASRPAIRNQDFRSGTAYWTFESGSGYTTSTYYRSNPTYPYSLYAYGGGQVKIRQDLTAATLDQVKGNYATFSFWFRSSNDVAKAELAVYDAYYETICHCYIGGWNYYDSSWIRASQSSGDLAWTNVVARGYVSSVASQAYVRIFLNDLNPSPYVASYVDDAALALFDSATGSSSYGNSALTFSLWKVDDYPSDARYRIGYLSVAMSGKGTGTYRIMSIQLRIELETSQDGRAWVEGVAEGNDQNLAVNPREQQKAREAGLQAAGIGVGIVTAIYTAGLGAGASLALGAASDAATTVLFNWIGESSTSFDTTAYGPGADYFTQVRWTYPSGGPCGWIPTYVGKASGANDAIWVYRPGIAGYRLKFVADITWGLPRSAVGRYGCPQPYLQYVGTTSLVGYLYP